MTRRQDYWEQPKTAATMYSAIGTLVAVRFESVEVNCRVTDVKSAYGELRLKVQPVRGSGEQWITVSRVTRVEEILEAQLEAR